ncbi:MAG TPA: hypothetical protein VJX70_05515 [Candidatus Acidoferrum sp.]|nr:hypothetical protein [Candidatus Acidoferrum sp.]
MAHRSPKGVFLPGCIASLCLFVTALVGSLSFSNAQQPQTANSEKKGEVYPRGMKLILTDGTYQLVREYQRNGERVRYYSLERGAWEELPASMVDWNATAKAEAEMEKESTALVEKVHKQEEVRRMDNVMDIDASLQVGDGAFLPSGEGMFVVEGKSIRILDQAGADSKTDKKRVIADVLSPVHMVPGKQTIELQGTHALVRLKSTHPEFYLREAPPDPDAPSSIKKSRRPGDSGPDVELVRTKVGRKNRQLDSISTLFGEAVKENVNEISMQRWEVAPNVYRFTLSQTLPPGEYVLAEVLGDGLNLYVWDFGVDTAGGSPSK